MDVNFENVFKVFVEFTENFGNAEKMKSSKKQMLPWDLTWYFISIMYLHCFINKWENVCIKLMHKLVKRALCNPLVLMLIS